jgi:hypothetical protein
MWSAHSGVAHKAWFSFMGVTVTGALPTGKRVR